MIFPFAIQPRRERGEISRLGVFPICDRAIDERGAQRRIDMGKQIEREKFMLRFCERMIFERAGKIGSVVRGGGILRFG